MTPVTTEPMVAMPRGRPGNRPTTTQLPSSPWSRWTPCASSSRSICPHHDTSETFGWDKAEAKEALGPELEQLAELQKRLFAQRRQAVLVVLQAMDAAGKDGVIRSVFTGINPAGVAVHSFGVPSEEEAEHDFLWRVHQACPRRGTIGVFNRSHYEDVLVVRVKELAPPERWQARYELIRRFEAGLVAEDTAIVKLFLHVSADEQRRAAAGPHRLARRAVEVPPR